MIALYLSESESANYWLSVLTDLYNRGVTDILITCVVRLAGFPDTIATIYPEAGVQLCIIHQLCNSIKYVTSKRQQAFPVYRAASKDPAEMALEELDGKWGSLRSLDKAAVCQHLKCFKEMDNANQELESDIIPISNLL